MIHVTKLKMKRITYFFIIIISICFSNQTISQEIKKDPIKSQIDQLNRIYSIQASYNPFSENNEYDDIDTLNNLIESRLAEILNNKDILTSNLIDEIEITKIHSRDSIL